MARFTKTIIPFPTNPLTPNLIRPGAGLEQWHNSSDRIPDTVESQARGTENSLNVYYRTEWNAFEGATQGSYKWAWLDDVMQDAIIRGQMVSFGIMGYRGENGDHSISYGGAMSDYPLYLHNLMQAEAANSRDFISSGGRWCVNHNSPNYIARLRALNQAVRNHLVTTSFTPTSGPNQGKTVLFADAVFSIDIRGFGTWGEWHSSNGMGNFVEANNGQSVFPAGRVPTIASLKAIIDAHTQILDRWPLTIMIAAYDGGSTRFPVFHPYPEVGLYALNARNAWGAVGFRKDQWGARDEYLATLAENNNVTYAGSQPFKTYILNKYKEAPITGEPLPGSGKDMSDLVRQVRLYHATSFGNGNYGGYPASLTTRDQIRLAGKYAGYRLAISDGDFNNTDTTLAIQLNWRNDGITPTYEDWDVVFKLMSGNNIAWSGISKFKPKLFQPSTTPTSISDSFIFNAPIPAGTYELTVEVSDPKKYKANMPLFIEGAKVRNVYTLGSVILGGTTPVPNQKPIVNAGVDQIVTLPTNKVVLQATASDPDGTIDSSSPTWIRVSGSGDIVNPKSYVTDVINLTEGVSIFKFSAADNRGDTASDNVSVTTKPEIIPDVVVTDIATVVTFSNGTTKTTQVFNS